MSESITKKPDSVCPGMKYSHYKGKFVALVVDIGKHTETQEPVVIYVHADDPKDHTIWVRPMNMWFDEVKPGVLRFTPIGESKEGINKSLLKPGFRCDTCKHPSHAGVWGKNYPSPCFWCKGEYVYPGHERAESCLEYDRMDTTYGDSRLVLA